jgi:hypothetical protein
VHHRLAIASPESLIKRCAMVIREVISNKRLTAVLVYSLQDLVCCRVPQTREEAEEAPHYGIGGV